MKQPKYIITGINQLSGEREAISRPMERSEAMNRLEREIESRKFQRYKAHTRLRIDKVEPVQLTIQFEQ